MRSRHSRACRAIPATALAVLVGGASGLLGVCGPFTDTANDAFCPFVLEILTLGATTGTTATTYSPNDNVSRLQMAAFLSRTVDAALLRGSRRAGLNQFWTTRAASSLGLTEVGTDPQFVKSDGVDLWVSDVGANAIVRVRASDGRLVETWTSGPSPRGMLVATGRVFAAGNTNPGRLYMLDPGAAAGAVTTVATTLGVFPQNLTYDGTRVWSANAGGSVSIVTPGAALPWTVTTVTTGFSGPIGALFDGSNVWIADFDADQLVKLDANGGILQTVTVGNGPAYPAFDGTNIWVPNLDNSVSVVRASSGVVLATLTGNGLAVGHQAAFDGRRILVTADSGVVSLWKAADLSEIGFLSTGALSVPVGACSDGVHFWVVLSGTGALARF